MVLAAAPHKNRWIRNGTVLTVGSMSDVQKVAWVRRVARSGSARVIREAAGLSASEIARAIEVSPAAVSRWERGQRVPREEAAERWADLLRGLSA
jgi:DNA-binding transcriptional regulator YiaG